MLGPQVHRRYILAVALSRCRDDGGPLPVGLLSIGAAHLVRDPYSGDAAWATENLQRIGVIGEMWERDKLQVLKPLSNLAERVAQ